MFTLLLAWISAKHKMEDELIYFYMFCLDIIFIIGFFVSLASGDL